MLGRDQAGNGKGLRAMTTDTRVIIFNNDDPADRERARAERAELLGQGFKFTGRGNDASFGQHTWWMVRHAEQGVK